MSFNRQERTTAWEGIFPSQVINQSHHMASSDRKCKSDLIILRWTERWPSSLSLYSVPDKIPVAGRHHPFKPQHSKHKSPHPSLHYAGHSWVLKVYTIFWGSTAKIIQLRSHLAHLFFYGHSNTPVSLISPSDSLPFIPASFPPQSYKTLKFTGLNSTLDWEMSVDHSERTLEDGGKTESQHPHPPDHRCLQLCVKGPMPSSTGTHVHKHVCILSHIHMHTHI